MGALLRQEVACRDLEIGSRHVLDQLQRDGLFLLRRIDILHGLAGHFHRDVLIVEGSLGDDAGQRAFQLADIAVDAVRDEIEDVVGDVEILLHGFLLENRHARLEIRRLDVGGHAPFETGTEPVLDDLDFPRMTVGGQDDGLVRVVKRVESVEKFLLRAFLGVQELDVVHQQDVDAAIFPLEFLRLAFPDGSDEVVQEFFAGDIEHAHIRALFQDVIPDGVHQVRLSESYAAIEEERVVLVEPRRMGDGELRDGQRRSVGHLVRIAAHEILEGIFFLQGRMVSRHDRGEMRIAAIGNPAARRTVGDEKGRLWRNRFDADVGGRFLGKQIVLLRSGAFFHRRDTDIHGFSEDGPHGVLYERNIMILYIMKGKVVGNAECEIGFRKRKGNDGDQPALAFAFGDRVRVPEVFQHFFPDRLDFVLFHKNLHLPKNRSKKSVIHIFINKCG